MGAWKTHNENIRLIGSTSNNDWVLGQDHYGGTKKSKASRKEGEAKEDLSGSISLPSETLVSTPGSPAAAATQASKLAAAEAAMETGAKPSSPRRRVPPPPPSSSFDDLRLMFIRDRLNVLKGDAREDFIRKSNCAGEISQYVQEGKLTL